jgi:hypothetical protein
VCELGASRVVLCDTMATCKDGGWQVSAPDPTDPACAPSPGSCPSGLADVPVDQSCTPPNIHCDFTDGRCECAQNAPVPGWPAAWKCASVRESFGTWTAKCPMSRPRLGTRCNVPGTSCDYGLCEVHGGNRQKCVPLTDGFAALHYGRWIDQPVDCACPATAPPPNAPCTRGLLACEYGSSPVSACDTIATCIPSSATSVMPNTTGESTWNVFVPDGSPPCATAPADRCPAPGQPIQGMACNSPSLDCDYADKRCECASGPTPQSASTWRCTDPLLAGPGCGPRPHLGTACPQEGLVCNYGACEVARGGDEVCQGVWVGVGWPCYTPSCPPSPPAPGSPCSLGEVCEYGTSNVAGCDTTAMCGDAGPGFVPFPLSGSFPPLPIWLVSGPDAGYASCQASAQSACPASFDTVPRGGGCDGGPAFCDYPQGRCECVAAAGSPGPTWSCQDPAPPCPKPRPRIGSSCAQEGLVCAYGPCGSSDSPTQICRSAVWLPLALDCSLDAGALLGPIDAALQ